MSDAPVRPGDILAGKYRVERVLGAGNMGVVVAATHVDLGQTVALKFMLPGKAATPEQRERFLREARAAVRLRSQHVARVLDVGTLETSSPYIVMEFLEGRDLGEILKERGPLPIEEAVEYVLQACEAVSEAHAAGIVHRDLKPANLFLTHDVSGHPCVKVVDFGISKVTGTELSLTHEAQALGSPLYMSPEQMNNSKGVDSRSDLWAFGIILYQLVAGLTPFHADTIQELYGRIFFGTPTPLGRHRPDAPPGFEAVILRCLERDREQRFQSVADLAAALEPYAPGRARVYAERISRMKSPAGARTSHPSIPAIADPQAASAPLPAALAATVPLTQAGSSPPLGPASPRLPVGSSGASMTGSPPAPAWNAQPAPSGSPPAAASSSPAVGRETSLSLTSSQGAASRASQEPPASPRRRTGLIVAGAVVAVVAPVVIFAVSRAPRESSEATPGSVASPDPSVSLSSPSAAAPVVVTPGTAAAGPSGAPTAMPDAPKPSSDGSAAPSSSAVSKALAPAATTGAKGPPGGASPGKGVGTAKPKPTVSYDERD